jgi:hypothetical protein
MRDPRRIDKMVSFAAEPLRMTAEILAFAKCRNERLRLPAFLDHYRRLGVGRFFIADNDSTDGSREYLGSQADVFVRAQPGSFRAARGGTDWLNDMLAEFGAGAWCVTADIDELLCYPGSERASLRLLTDYLDRSGYEALSCLLLDVYPPVALRRCEYESGRDLFSIAPHFDPGPYERRPFHLCPGVMIRGGMRERVFYPEFRSRSVFARIARRLRRARPPCLTKVPLVRWDSGSQYLHYNHFVSTKRVAPESGALLHFKFLQDFHGRAVEEATRGEYYDGATEYRRYAASLNRDPDAALMYEGSIPFEGTEQLATLGLIHDTEAWAAYRVIGTT